MTAHHDQHSPVTVDSAEIRLTRFITVGLQAFSTVPGGANPRISEASTVSSLLIHYTRVKKVDGTVTMYWII